MLGVEEKFVDACKKETSIDIKVGQVNWLGFSCSWQRCFYAELVNCCSDIDESKLQQLIRLFTCGRAYAHAAWCCFCLPASWRARAVHRCEQPGCVVVPLLFSFFLEGTGWAEMLGGLFSGVSYDQKLSCC